ncbi:hypothetical protein ACFQ51_00640 [Streptomyces kaempferi]
MISEVARWTASAGTSRAATPAPIAQNPPTPMPSRTLAAAITAMLGRRCQDVGGGTEQRESDQDLTPVEPSRGDGDQGSSDRSHQAGYDDDQADGGFSDAPSTWL